VGRPVRTCVACRLEAGKTDLVRLVRRAGGAIGVDRTGKSQGRGAYLHAEEACFNLARKRRAIERALGASVPPEVWVEVSKLLRPA
jgi:predicted RNA-binding protein YlxR (DUF448 family)